MRTPKTSPRRDFLVGSGATVLCAGCSLFTKQGITHAELQSSSGKITLNANATEQLKTPGSIYRVQVPEGPRLIIIRNQKSLVALSAACTHWGSDVEPNNSGELECPTHGSRFAADTGALLEGPASSPLQRFVIAESATTGEITITLAG